MERERKAAERIASFIAKDMDSVTNALRPMLSFAHGVSKVIGYGTMEGITRGLFRISGHRFPLWTRYTPSGARKLDYTTETPLRDSPKWSISLPALPVRWGLLLIMTRKRE